MHENLYYEKEHENWFTNMLLVKWHQSDFVLLYMLENIKSQAVLLQSNVVSNANLIKQLICIESACFKQRRMNCHSSPPHLSLLSVICV